MPERVHSRRAVLGVLGYAFVALVVTGVLAVSEHPALGLLAIGPLLVARRATRLGLVLHADHAEVVEPLRTRRIPYADVEMVEVGDDGTISILRTEGGSVVAHATAGLPLDEAHAVRDRLVSYVRALRPVEAEDELDERPPYQDVLRLLEAEDPDGSVANGHSEGYLYEAEELADVLRERPVTAADVWEALAVDDDYDTEALAERLNALR